MADPRQDTWDLSPRDQAALGLLVREYDGLLAVAEQAVVLYEGLRADAEIYEDWQGGNFWEGHRDAAMVATGAHQAGASVVDAALAAPMGPAPRCPMALECIPGAPTCPACVARAGKEEAK